MYIRRAFGRSGEDRFSGVITKANATGFGGGLILGLGCAVVVWGISLTTGAVGLLIALLGTILTIRVGGLSVFDRVWLRGWYGLRRATGTTFVPPSTRRHTAGDSLLALLGLVDDMRK